MAFTVVLAVLRILLACLEALFRFVIRPGKKSVKGKVVLVTGGGAGIGQALAMQFHELGATVVLLDINQANVEAVAAQIREAGGKAHAYRCDVSDYADVRNVAARVRADAGRVDVLVNNAGVARLQDFVNLTEDDIRTTIGVNTLAHFWTLKEFLPDMIQRNDGHVVTIASMAGKGGSPYLTDYCASKFAVVGLTEALRDELRTVYRTTGVFTTTVMPMHTNTALLQNHMDRLRVREGLMSPIMTPAYVVTCVVDGVLRNRLEVYIPKLHASTDLLRALLPSKAADIAKDNFVSAYEGRDDDKEKKTRPKNE